MGLTSRSPGKITCAVAEVICGGIAASAAVSPRVTIWFVEGARAAVTAPSLAAL